MKSESASWVWCCVENVSDGEKTSKLNFKPKVDILDRFLDQVGHDIPAT
jgi:hypothetical protein